MRFLMINLILVCLLLFGIGYLAFGDTETGTVCDPHTAPHVHAIEDTPRKVYSEPFQQLLHRSSVA